MPDRSSALSASLPLLLAAASEQEARAMLEQDPSIQKRVFGYELHPFAVFYGGCVESGRPRG